MATFVFGMNLSLDGYVDHLENADRSRAMFRHWTEHVRARLAARRWSPHVRDYALLG